MKKLVIILVLGISFSSARLLATEITLDSIYSVENQKLSIPVEAKKIYLYFWATWCPECVATLKKNFSYVKNLNEKFIIPISTEKNMKRVNYFKKKYSIKRELYIEPKRSVIKLLDIKEVPLWTVWRRAGAHWVLEKKQLGKLEE